MCVCVCVCLCVCACVCVFPESQLAHLTHLELLPTFGQPSFWVDPGMEGGFISRASLAQSWQGHCAFIVTIWFFLKKRFSDYISLRPRNTWIFLTFVTIKEQRIFVL